MPGFVEFLHLLLQHCSMPALLEVNKQWSGYSDLNRDDTDPNRMPYQIRPYPDKPNTLTRLSYTLEILMKMVGLEPTADLRSLQFGPLP